MLLTQEDDLSGLPDGAKEAAQQLAESKDLEGWLFTLDYPSYIPFMTYANSDAARLALYKEFRKRGHPKNFEVLKSLLQSDI